MLDLSRVLAGPWCGQTLADLGAEVIKVERPGSGDDTRGWGPPFMLDADGSPTREAAFYQSANRGKASVAINIADPAGQGIVRALAAQSDIALLDVQVASLANQAMGYLASGSVPGRYGNAHASIVPYQVFDASDGRFVVACGNDSQFVALCEAIGLPDLPRDPRLVRNAGRVENREEVVAILAARLRTGEAAEWIARINAAGVPVGAMNDIAQALDEPQVRARGMVVGILHPLQPALEAVGSPINLSDTPVQ